MQMKTKPLITLTVVVGILLFFALNHWMSGEISKPATELPAQNTPNETAVVEHRPLNVPTASVPTENQEPTETLTVQPQERTNHAEPVYDPPSNDVILVQ